LLLCGCDGFAVGALVDAFLGGPENKSSPSPNKLSPPPLAGLVTGVVVGGDFVSVLAGGDAFGGPKISSSSRFTGFLAVEVEVED